MQMHRILTPFNGSTRTLTPLVTWGLATGTSGTVMNPLPAVLAVEAHALRQDGLGRSWRSQFDCADLGLPQQAVALNGLPWQPRDL